jgi:hypothetical protein
VSRVQTPHSRAGARLGRARGIAGAAWRLASLTAMLAAGALALFHAWIFWDRLVTGRLAEGGSALRWISGVVLLASLHWLKRQGVSLWRGRPAMTAWLLVVLLHVWSAGAQPAAGSESPPPVDTAASAFLLPLTAAALAGLAVLLLAGRRSGQRWPLAAAHAWLAPTVPCGPHSHPLAIRVPRAPPFALA